MVNALSNNDKFMLAKGHLHPEIEGRAKLAKYGKNAINIFYVLSIPKEIPISRDMIISPYCRELIVNN